MTHAFVTCSSTLLGNRPTCLAPVDDVKDQLYFSRPPEFALKAGFGTSLPVSVFRFCCASQPLRLCDDRRFDECASSSFDRKDN